MNILQIFMINTLYCCFFKISHGVRTHSTRFNKAINLLRYTLFLLAQRFQLNKRLDLIHHLPFFYVNRMGTNAYNVTYIDNDGIRYLCLRNFIMSFSEILHGRVFVKNYIESRKPSEFNICSYF